MKSENEKILALVELMDRRKGNRRSSIDKRMERLGCLMAWAGDQSVTELDRNDLEDFLDTRVLGASGRQGYIYSLRVLYDYLGEEGMVESNPARMVRAPRVPRGLPRPADDDEVRALVRTSPPKERCWVLLAGLAGLRCCEIAGLRREDIMERTMQIRCSPEYAKGGKERWVPLHKDTLSALRCLPMPERGFIFVRPRGGKYPPSQMSRDFSRYLRDNGVNAVPHQLRHWFASTIYNNTGDIRLVQELLGHADVSTTMIYTRLDPSKSAPAVAELSLV